MNKTITEIKVDEYDIWNVQKKAINNRALMPDLHCFEREIWWCSLGKNIGNEKNGKHEYFERPVIIFRKFGEHMLWAIPLTSKIKDPSHRDSHTFTCNEITRSAHLSQMRPVSVQRLLRFIDIISYEEFQAIRKKLVELMKSGTRLVGGFLGGQSLAIKDRYSLSEQILKSNFFTKFLDPPSPHPPSLKPSPREERLLVH